MDAIEVGKRVKKYRERAGLTQNGLATKAGVAPSYIPDIEKGKKCPTVQTLGYICFGLGITLAEFFLDTDEQKELTAAIQTLTARLTPKQQSLLLEFIKTI